MIEELVDKNSPRFLGLLDHLFSHSEISGVIRTYPHSPPKIVKTISGGESTVRPPPKGRVTFHTHTRDNYLNSGSYFSPPSGEDMRECIKSSLRGATLAHVVFSIEGCYVIQVNPYLKKLLRGMRSERVRGLLIKCIEIYFRALHIRRTVDFNSKQKGKANEGPGSWVKTANSFRIDKIDEVYSPDPSHPNKTIKLNSALKEYDMGTYFGKYSKHGVLTGVLNMPSTIKVSNLVTYSDNIKLDWIFRAQFFPNKIKGGSYSTLFKTNSPKKLMKIVRELRPGEVSYNSRAIPYANMQ